MIGFRLDPSRAVHIGYALPDCGRIGQNLDELVPKDAEGTYSWSGADVVSVGQCTSDVHPPSGVWLANSCF